MKKNITVLAILICLISSSSVFSQSGFRFFDPNQKKTRVKFKLINNLIIIPLEINNRKLNFILDTGVNKTILFNLSDRDSLQLKNVRRVNLQGLGTGDSVESLLSRNNTFVLNNLISYNESIHLVINDKFDLSAKMGITINGIIGYRLLKDLIVKIDYNKKYLTFFNPKNNSIPKCKNCEEFRIELIKNKPYMYVDAQIDTIGTKKTKVKLLIDSGGSDAFWLFEHTKENIVTPNKHFKDILGEGLSGTIYGNRSRIPKVSIGSYEIEEPTVSFLDTISTKMARQVQGRNGSLGGNILKRFRIWIDYPNKRIILKKTGSLKGGFNYNMSGLDIIHNGRRLVKIKEPPRINTGYGRSSQTSGNTSLSILTTYRYKFRPSYIINNVLENSPGGEAGLKVGDVILSINRKHAHTFKLSNINKILQSYNNRKIVLVVERDGKKMEFKFRLRKII
ncbi:aspartyl protease family protein [Pseudotenacibaculum sp. MALMAid0570]|uniref:aspartyl protease family protein n=1 Tax=Pseudotenacibaculum sp. MALMAid0570 TaxID=3143938 RepID=UPI0032DF13F5